LEGGGGLFPQLLHGEVAELLNLVLRLRAERAAIGDAASLLDGSLVVASVGERLGLGQHGVARGELGWIGGRIVWRRRRGGSRRRRLRLWRWRRRSRGFAPGAGLLLQRRDNLVLELLARLALGHRGDDLLGHTGGAEQRVY